MESMNKNNEFVIEQGKNCAISTIDYSQPTDHHYIPCVQHPVCVYMETTYWPTECPAVKVLWRPNIHNHFLRCISTFLRTFVSVCIAIVDCRERCILFFGDGECVIKKSLFQMCIKKTNWYAVSFTYRRTPYIYLFIRPDKTGIYVSTVGCSVKIIVQHYAERYASYSAVVCATIIIGTQI